MYNHFRKTDTPVATAGESQAKISRFPRTRMLVIIIVIVITLIIVIIKLVS